MTITAEFKEKYMSDKFLYDSLSQAIKLAKDYGLDANQIKSITLAKQELKTHCVKQNEKLLKGMSLSCNVVHLADSWYTIRHLNDKGEVVSKQECLRADDIHLITRDSRHEPELRRSQFDELLHGIQDEVALDLYKRELRANARFLVQQYTGLFIEQEKEVVHVESIDLDMPMQVSSHAGMRWVQRELNMHTKDDKKAEDHRRSNLAWINMDILDRFGTANEVWKSDKDGVTYWFSEQGNIMFVVSDNVIVTLYAKDFGFTADMNRMIVYEQLKVLAQAYDNLRIVEQEQDDSVDGIKRGITSIDAEMALLEAKMSELVSKRTSLGAQKDHASKVVRLARTTYDVEFDKLFKKWEK